MKTFFKKFSEYSVSLFLITSIVGGANLLGLFQGGLALKQRSAPTEYDRREAKTYSGNEATAVFQSNQKLDENDLVGLIDRMKVPIPVEETHEPTVSVPKDDSEFCKESVNLLKGERDARIQSEKENKFQQRFTFVLTVLVGLILLALKSKNIGQKIFKEDNENRDLAVNGVEFLFAVILIAITIW